MDEIQFKNLVAFIVLMENCEGIADKTPEYIKEKYNRFLDNGFTDGEVVWGLDATNKQKFLNYFSTGNGKS